MEIPAGGSEIFTLKNQFGCDSVLTVNVTELPHTEGETTLSACEGGSANFLGVDIPAGGFEVFIIENQFGCDSILNVNVNELLHSEGETTISACKGSTANFLGIDIPAGQQVAIASPL